MALKKILITDGVHPKMIPTFEQMGFEVDYLPKIALEKVYPIVGRYEGMIINSKIICDKKMFDAATRLEFIGRLGSGMEIIDQVYAAQKGVAVFNAPDGNCDAVAEHALGMLLMLAHKLQKGDTEVRQMVWQREANRGFELGGLTVGIIGFGYTGRAFAQRLRGFRTNILAYDKYQRHYADHLDYVLETDMEHIFEQADIVSFHLPLTPEVVHLADDAYIAHFKKNIIVINTSRGKVIPTRTLVQGLQSGKIRGACLDVFENEKPFTYTAAEKDIYQQLFSFPQTVFSPHVAGWTVESKERLADILIQKIRNFYQKPDY